MEMNRINLNNMIRLLMIILLILGCESPNSDDENEQVDQDPVWEDVSQELPINSSLLLTSVEDRLYVFTEAKLFTSEDQGDTWTRIGSGVPDSVQLTAFDGLDSIIVLTTYSHGVWVSRDHGETFYQPSNEGLDPTWGICYSVLIIGNTLFAGAGENAVVYKSSDLGETWSAHNEGLPSRTPAYHTAIGLLREVGSRVLASPQSSGIYESTDYGETWFPFSTGLPSKAHVFDFAISDSFLFASVVAAEFSYERGMFRRSFEDWRWTAISNLDWSDWDLHFVVASDSIVVTSGANGILISRDNGTSWQYYNEGLGDLSEALFYQATIQDNYIYSVKHARGLYRLRLHN